MTTSTLFGKELVELAGHACVRSGRGRGCYQSRWMTCSACGWHSEPFDGEPGLVSLAHMCNPAEAERQTRIIGGGDG